MEPKAELSSGALDWCKEMGIKGKTVEDVLSGADNARFEFNSYVTSNCRYSVLCIVNDSSHL